MADVLIKGMEMPIDGDYLFSFASGEKETICRIEKVSRDWSGTPIQYRMVVELPTHGRLIDADELLGKQWDADTRCGYVQVVDVGDINDAPTVIEASEEDA